MTFQLGKNVGNQNCLGGNAERSGAYLGDSDALGEEKGKAKEKPGQLSWPLDLPKPACDSSVAT